jgi:hypothetical protein
MRYVPVEGADVTLNRAKQNTWAERHAGPECQAAGDKGHQEAGALARRT